MENWEYNTGDPNYVHKDYTPNPGTQDAIDAGCTCPVMDNRYGLGYYGAEDGVFIYNEDCPIHRQEEQDDD